MENKQQEKDILKEGRLYLISKMQTDSSGLTCMSGLYEVNCELVTDKHYKIVITETKEVYWIAKEWEIVIEEDVTEFYRL